MAQIRRAKGMGSVRQRGRGKWEIRYYGPPDVDGESRRIYETVSGTRPQAEAVLRKRRGAIEAGQYVPRTKETVAEYIDRWFVIYARTNTTPRTQQGYDGYIRNHIKPYLGRIPLQALRTEHVQSLYSVMLERGQVTSRQVV